MALTTDYSSISTAAVFDHAAGSTAWLAINGVATKVAVPAQFAAEFNASYAGRPVTVVLRKTYASYVRDGRHRAHTKLTLVDIDLALATKN